MAARIKIATGQNVFGLKNGDQLVASQTGFGGIYFDDDVVKVILDFSS